MPNQNSNQIITAAHITTTSSPIPPADEMERYNQIDPSIVKEIMRIYADNSNHNRKPVLLLIIVAISLVLGNTTFAGLSGFAFMAYVLISFLKKR